MNKFLLKPSFQTYSIFFIFLAFLSSCESYPNDPNHSLKEAKAKMMRVGVMEAPPWSTVKDGEPKGIEVDLIKGFANAIDSEIEWVAGTEEELMLLLKEYELHAVVGGVTNDSPWKKHVGFTDPYTEEKVFVCNTTGESLPEEIEGLRVGVQKGSPVGAYVKKKDGIPVYLDALEKYKGLVGVYEHDLEKFQYKRSDLIIKKEKHVIAVPRGENNLLMTLERYIDEAGY